MTIEIFLMIGTIFFFTVILIYIVSWGIARFWCKPKRITPKRTPADYGLAYEDILFFSGNVKLKGWFVPCSDGTFLNPVIILAHGWSSCKSFMLPYARNLERAGYSILLYDARGHGNSGTDGPITIRKMGEDILAAVDFLMTRRNIDLSRIGILGSSMGGSSAILAASMDDRIRAVISISAFASPINITNEFLKRFHLPSWPFNRLVFHFIEKWLGTTMNHVAPENRISFVNAPLLLTHGENDNNVSPSNMEVLYLNAMKVKTKKLLVSKRGHFDIIRDNHCNQAISTFLMENL